MKKIILIFVVLILVISCMLMAFSCTNATAPTTQTAVASGASSVTQNTSSTKKVPKTYYQAESPTAGFRIHKLPRTLVKTEIKTTERTVTDRNPWLFLAGPVGAILYAVGTDHIEQDVYSVNYYKTATVEGETIWSMIPVHHPGGKVIISASREQITEKGIEKSLKQSVTFNFGVELESVLTVGVSTTTEVGFTEIYKQSIGKAESASFDLSGFEPNRYYRLAIKLDYNLYEVIVTDSNNKIVEKRKAIEPILSRLYARLESSDKKDFSE